MRYFDAHCHIQFSQYDADREQIVERMHQAEVFALVVGTDLESSKKAIILAQEHEHLFASVGLHPNAVLTESFEYQAYRELARDPKVLAIGECGLDNFRPEDVEVSKPKQREVFLEHVRLAVGTGKPLMIHSRPSKGTQDAYRDLIDILTSAKREYGEKLRGNIHFFVGGIEEAREFLALDFTMSYTAVLTFARDYDEVVKYIPLTHLLTETDSPYIAPAPRRGQRNDPLAVIDVVEIVASIRNENTETVKFQLLENAKRLFRFQSVLVVDTMISNS